MAFCTCASPSRDARQTRRDRRTNPPCARVLCAARQPSERPLVAGENLTSQHSLLRDVGRDLGELEVVGELGPRVRRGRDLGERAVREASDVWVQGEGGDVAGRLQGEPVVDVRGDRPQLLAALDRLLAAIRELDEIVPGASLAGRVHPAQQRVEVLGLDQRVDVALHAPRA
jgi:hypothetical protein